MTDSKKTKAQLIAENVALRQRLLTLEASLGIPGVDINERMQAEESPKESRDITERKRTEEALRASEAQLRSITNNLPVLIGYVDADERQRFVNQTCADWFGRPVEEIIGRHVKEIHGPEYEKFKPHIQTVLAGKKVIFEKTVTYPDQVHRAVRVNYVPHLGGNGKVLGFFALVEDISEHKRAQRSQQITQEYLDSILFHLPVGVAILEGPDLIYYRINQNLADLNGIPVGDHLGRPLAEVLPHAKDSIIPTMRKIMETGVPTLGREFSITLPKDPKIPVHLCDWIFPIKGPEGLPSAIGAVVLDITERKRAEEALSESEIKHKTLLRNIPGMVYRARPDWSAEIYSDSRKISGYTAEELNALDENWLSIIHPDDKDTVQRESSELVKTPTSIVQQYRIVTKDHSVRWVEDHKISLFANGEFVGIDGILFDINERTLSWRMRNFEETERRHFARELHDEIGQNLTGLKINLESLQNRRKIEDVTDKILKACLEIVEGLLVRVRNLALDLRPMKLDDLGLSAALRWLIDQQANIGGFTGRYSEGGKVDSLPTELATICFRVVQEALTNVVRHAGATHVRVELQRFYGGLQFLIEDDGKGFDTSEATMRARAGESMGLLSMRERVELSGGHFEMNSAAGRGTTVRATLPLKSAIQV